MGKNEWKKCRREWKRKYIRRIYLILLCLSVAGHSGFSALCCQGNSRTSPERASVHPSIHLSVPGDGPLGELEATGWKLNSSSLFCSSPVAAALSNAKYMNERIWWENVLSVPGWRGEIWTGRKWDTSWAALKWPAASLCSRGACRRAENNFKTKVRMWRYNGGCFQSVSDS